MKMKCDFCLGKATMTIGGRELQFNLCKDCYNVIDKPPKIRKVDEINGRNIYEVDI